MSDHANDTPPVHLPAPTPWPMVMGLGIALMPAGLVVGPRLGPEGTFLGWIAVVTLLGLLLFWVALYKMIREDLDLAAEQGAH